MAVPYPSRLKAEFADPPCTYQVWFDAPTAPSSDMFVRVAGWVAAQQPISRVAIVNHDAQSPVVAHDAADVIAATRFPCAVRFTKVISRDDHGLTPSLEFEIGGDLHREPIPTSWVDESTNDFDERKQQKLARIRDLLVCPECRGPLTWTKSHSVCTVCQHWFPIGYRNYDFLTKPFRSMGKISATDNVSAHSYDPVAVSHIERLKDGLILDNGCGIRDTYYDNVVNFEIVDYVTTDVVGIGERLPFADDSFDAVFTLNVLEHVRQPFEVAAEIVRVLKPGGALYAVVPFLQPVHGYPEHYYNMTKTGLANVFGEAVEIESHEVPLSGTPIWALCWFLGAYVEGLPPSVAKELMDMRISDFLVSPEKLLDHDIVTALRPETNAELACTTSLVGHKRSSSE